MRKQSHSSEAIMDSCSINSEDKETNSYDDSVEGREEEMCEDSTSDTDEYDVMNNSKTASVKKAEFENNLLNGETHHQRKNRRKADNEIKLSLEQSDTEEDDDEEDDNDLVSEKKSEEGETYLEAHEVKDASVSNAISSIIQQSIGKKASKQKTEYVSDVSNRELDTDESMTDTEELDVDLSRIKPEVDKDNRLIVMNKHTKFNARIKPDTSTYRHKCNKCLEVFQWPHKLKKHMEIVHEGKYPYHCKVCNKPFDRKSGLSDHMMVHTDDRPYPCEICKKSFKFKGNLTKHIKEIHMGEVLQFQCEYCDKIFNAKEKLVAHFVVHNEEKNFVCGICGKRFHRKNNLSEHQVIHSTEKKYECTVCGLSFNRKYALKIHSRNHMDVKPYKCELCPASFTQMHALKNHIRRHTGERPYKCDYCDRSFAQQSTLQVHTKRHTGEKNFTCGVCQQSFVIKRRLQEHLRVHTGEKPFQCELCPFRAAISSGLKYHMQTHMRRLQREVEGESLKVMNGESSDTVDDVLVVRSSPKIDDGDLRRNRLRKVKPPKKRLRKPKGGSTSKKQGSRKTDASIGATLTKIAKNAKRVKEKRKHDIISNGATTDGPFRSPTLRAMLEGTLPSVDLNHFSNFSVVSPNVTIDRQLIRESIDKVVGAFGDNGGTVQIPSEFPPVSLNVLQNNTVYTTSNKKALPINGEERDVHERTNEINNETGHSESGVNLDVGKPVAEFHVDLNNDRCDGHVQVDVGRPGSEESVVLDDNGSDEATDIEEEKEYNYTFDCCKNQDSGNEENSDDDVIVIEALDTCSS